MLLSIIWINVYVIRCTSTLVRVRRYTNIVARCYTNMLRQHVSQHTTPLRDAHARSTQSVFQGRDRQVVPPAREQEAEVCNCGWKIIFDISWSWPPTWRHLEQPEAALKLLIFHSIWFLSSFCIPIQKPSLIIRRVFNSVLRKMIFEELIKSKIMRHAFSHCDKITISELVLVYQKTLESK